MLEPTPFDAYPLLAVVPGATVEAGDFGVVEAQLVLTGWNDPPLTDELQAELTVEAHVSARWALEHGHLTQSGAWAVVPCRWSGVMLRLELISWAVIDAYGRATRH